MTLELLTRPDTYVSLLTLKAMEIVLGIVCGYYGCGGVRSSCMSGSTR